MCVYGSLKRGFYNNYLLKDETFISEVKMRKAKLYSLGAYPGIKESKNMNDIVFAEIYHVKNKNIHIRINNMESGAGYECKTRHFKINGLKIRAKVYFYKYDMHESKRILSGKWEAPQNMGGW